MLADAQLLPCFQQLLAQRHGAIASSAHLLKLLLNAGFQLSLLRVFFRLRLLGLGLLANARPIAKHAADGLLCSHLIFTLLVIWGLAVVFRLPKLIGLLHEGAVVECALEGVLLGTREEQAESELALHVGRGVRVAALEQLVDLVDHQDVRHVAHSVLPVLGQVYIELEIIVISCYLEHGLVKFIFLHYAANHVGMNELVDLFNGHVHPVVRADVSLQLQEVPADVIDVNE